MNKLKFTNYNVHNQPLNIILTKANGDVQVLDYCPYTRYYDSADKQYNSYKSFFKINNRIYV